jgi:hypothetical protein
VNNASRLHSSCLHNPRLSSIKQQLVVRTAENDRELYSLQIEVVVAYNICSSGRVVSFYSEDNLGV